MSDLFKFHKLNEAGQNKAMEIQRIFESTLEALLPILGEGREGAIVKTKLEEACFFAKKAMAIQKHYQE